MRCDKGEQVLSSVANEPTNLDVRKIPRAARSPVLESFLRDSKELGCFRTGEKAVQFLGAV